MTPTLDDPLQSPQDSDAESTLSPQKTRSRLVKSPLNAVATLPYRRSNASLSNLFASTSSLPGSPVVASSESGTSTPTAGFINGSIFSPGGSTVVRSASPSTAAPLSPNAIRDLTARALAPHVSILASQDTEELVRHKGIHGGFLELVRPFGDVVMGKVTIRDGTGASRSWEDFGIRFVGVQDGLQPPRMDGRTSMDSVKQADAKRLSALEYKPARLRTGGDVPQIEDLIERHLTFAEEQSGPLEASFLKHGTFDAGDPRLSSPFFVHYIRRLLSGLPLVTAETFSHPVASVIAISSRCPSPIEELRNLYSSSNAGENRLPQWVHNEFLRYYVLVHDEDYDDITKSMALFDQMKRHFGLHCHLLRLRSTQCAASDDGSVKLPTTEWLSAAEELAEITRRENSEDDEDPTPYVFETDAAAIRVFVREMVTQSVVPSMERASATWNDQVASRRRGFSGRFMSLSKRFTGFGTRNSSMPAIAGGGSNYDSLQGFYRPDAPEALMRKLADYAMMLRDYKLAQSTYEILCQDFKNDKAWRHYAAANEMMAISSLLANTHVNSKLRGEIDQYIENAYYSYTTRVGAPYNALRLLLICAELLKSRSGSAVDDSARWSSKVLSDRLVGPVGHILTMERIAACYTERKGFGTLQSGTRRRKAAFWNMLATDAWLRLDKASQAQVRLGQVSHLYDVNDGALRFDDAVAFLTNLGHGVRANRGGLHHLDTAELLAAKLSEARSARHIDDDDDDPDETDNASLQSEDAIVEPLEQAVGPRHRSHSGATAPPLVAPSVAGHRRNPSVLASTPAPTAYDDPLGAVPSAYEERSGNTVPRKLPSHATAAAADLSDVATDQRTIDPGKAHALRDDGFE